jgi:pimeloyl-ACP methyl ester carboxylesterase
LADTIVAAESNRQTSETNLFGFSAGGILAIEAAEKIITDNDTSLHVDTIYLAATPSGPESLREGQVENIEALNFVADVIPGARYSSSVRFLISMVSDVDQYAGKGIAAFQRVWASNVEEIRERSEPGVRQLDDQTLAIMNADIPKSLKHISEQRGIKQMPVLVYLAAEDPTADTTVDNNAASEAICSAANEVGIACKVVKVPGAVHSVYSVNAEAYASVLADAKDEINAMIEKERLLYDAAQSPAISFTTSIRPQ